MTTITRFAPSPTGYLHIGGARTALFNYLYSKHNNGKFLLRIEDTDKERSTKPAIDAILNGLKWLGLNWDDEEIYQSSRITRHQEVVQQLLDNGDAYYCYASKEELDAMRTKAIAEKRPLKYDGTWRYKSKEDAPKGIQPVVRLKAPMTGETIINDLVQGKVVVKNIEQDDMVLLRSDGTPTYMLAVVVDDHDMEITHIIRGDDHLTNASRQKLIYDAMNWQIPEFAHIPLIHGPDGTKLSKRHGALGVEIYRDMGYLPEAMCNYLLRLGWSHGDDEIINTKQAIEWFNIENVGKSPARFDFNKLNNLNGHYIREAENNYLLSLIKPMLESKTGTNLSQLSEQRLAKGMNGLKQRAKTLQELSDNAIFYIVDKIQIFSDKAKESLGNDGISVVKLAIEEIEKITNFEHDNIEMAFRTIAEKQNIKLGNLMAPIRACITGNHNSPSMFEVLEVLGKRESLQRLRSVVIM